RGEPGVLLPAPLHWGAGIVSAGLTRMVQVLRNRYQARFDQLTPLPPDFDVVVVLYGSERVVRHTEFVALIEEGGRTLREHQRGQCFGRAFTPSGAVVTKVGDRARVVVVA